LEKKTKSKTRRKAKGYLLSDKPQTLEGGGWEKEATRGRGLG